MIFTNEEFERVSQNEKVLDRLVHSGYMSAAFPRLELDAYQEMHKRIAKHAYPLNRACGRCIANFLRTIGEWYFRDKDERLAQKALVDVPDKSTRIAPAEGENKAVSGPQSTKAGKPTGKVFKTRKTKNTKK